VGGEASGPPPALLRDTGLYADFATLKVDSRHLAFAPQYPLWTDGAVKRRWISLPPGTAIDASDPDAWVFPVGTRFWKEFAFGGRRIETRMLERLPDGWRYAAYEWSADGREATLAPAAGQRGAFAFGGGRSHTIPGVTDCKVCHEGRRTPVLGFSLLQLSPDRDSGAPHAESVPAPGVDLAYLVRAGLLVGLPGAMLEAPPRIEAATATERAALGYLHGNCGHCHSADGKLANIGLFLRHVAGAAAEPAVATTVGRPVRKPAPGQSTEAALRVAPGHPARSALAERMGSRWAALQMPPLGTELVDEDALNLVRQWIAELEVSQAEARQEGQRQ
jgi:cytochrome c553